MSTSKAVTASNQFGPELADLDLAQLMQIEIPTVVSASKFEQKATAAPALVTVVSADDIKRYGYRTLADVLLSVPGFNVSYDRNYAYLSFQGISQLDSANSFNSRMLVLVDGHRMNNNLNDAAYIDNAFLLDMDLVDRVEVIQGPNAVLYGNNAFFGVINVVTRKAGQVHGLEVSGDYGSFDSYKGRMSYGISFTNGVKLLLSGSYYNSGGADHLTFELPPQNNNVRVQGLDGGSYEKAFGSLGYGDFTLEGGYGHAVKDNPTAQDFTAFNVSGLQTVDSRGYADLKFAHEFPEIVDVTARVYYDFCDHSIGFPFGPNRNPFYKESQSGKWWGTELQLSKRVWEKHTLILGAEYRDDFEQEGRVFEPATGQTFSDNHGDRQSHGVYAEGDMEILSKLHLSIGGRYDQYGDFNPKYSPRVALIYEPFEKSTLKAIYGTAFRVPNFLELSDPRFQNINPEEVTSYQLIWDQGIGRNLRSSVTGFFNQMNDLIVFANGNYGNIDAESKGVELALDGNWAKGLRGRASYTFQNVQNRSTSQDVPDSPENLVKLNLSVPIYKEKVYASLEFRYTSSRNSFFTTTSGQTIPGSDVAEYSILNFTLFSQNLVKNLEFSASVYNLLDQSYSDPATGIHAQSEIPQDGRTFRVKLTYRF